MKMGFSSLVCPTWDLSTIVDKASGLGFHGVELRGLRGELHLPLVPDLAARPDRVRNLFSEKKVELVCLGSSASLSSRNKRENARQAGIIVEFMELASRLGCPFVRIFAGQFDRGDSPERAIARMAEALRSLAALASRLDVTLLVENGGDFSSSQVMWYLIDAVGHPAVRCCWNQCSAMTDLETPTLSIPRLGNKIGLTHICDADVDGAGVLRGYKLPGDGTVGVARQIDLLRGVAYRGYLMFEWPKLWVESLPDADSVLPAVADFLNARLNSKQAILTAYKGDKNAPRFVGNVTAPAAS